MSNREYPENPIIGVGAVVLKGDKILLIKRGNPPLAGEWSIPGGRLEEVETIIEAVNREVSEECNIKIDVHDIIDIFEYIERDEKNLVKYHYIVFDFKATYVNGKLNYQSDAADAEWVNANELGDYKMKKETREMILKALNL